MTSLLPLSCSVVAAVIVLRGLKPFGSVHTLAVPHASDIEKLLAIETHTTFPHLSTSIPLALNVSWDTES